MRVKLEVLFPLMCLMLFAFGCVGDFTIDTSISPNDLDEWEGTAQIAKVPWQCPDSEDWIEDIDYTGFFWKCFDFGGKKFLFSVEVEDGSILPEDLNVYCVDLPTIDALYAQTTQKRVYDVVFEGQGGGTWELAEISLGDTLIWPIP